LKHEAHEGHEEVVFIPDDPHDFAEDRFDQLIRVGEGLADPAEPLRVFVASWFNISSFGVCAEFHTLDGETESKAREKCRPGRSGSCAEFDVITCSLARAWAVMRGSDASCSAGLASAERGDRGGVLENKALRGGVLENKALRAGADRCARA
jgi:hypothetical protein